MPLNFVLKAAEFDFMHMQKETFKGSCKVS